MPQTGCQWVTAPCYGNDLPSSEDAKFILDRSASGLWSVAIRGYSNGTNLDVEIGESNAIAIVADQPHEVLDFYSNVMPLEPEQAQEYCEAITRQESRSDMLIQTLESGAQGVWSLLSPAEFNSYDSFGSLIYEDANYAALRWGNWSRENTGSFSYGGYDGYYTSKPVAVRVIKEGSGFKVKPFNPNKKGLKISAITERTKNYPTLVGLERPLSEGDSRELRYLNDAFEYGSATVDEGLVGALPTERLYGSQIV